MDLKSILEAILFASQKPLSNRELREVLANTADRSEEEAPKAFRKIKDDEIEASLLELEKEHIAAGRTYRLVCVAGAWQFVSNPEFAPWLKTMFGERTRPPRLSQPALETLAIISYRQPMTRAEIEQIRGVAVDGVMQTLLERGLVESAGRAEVVGRPMTYATTPLFLEYFGLKNLEELPAADELRRIPVQKPESLLTAEPGLATSAPEEIKEAVPSTPEEPSALPGDKAEVASESEPEAGTGEPSTESRQ